MKVYEVFKNNDWEDDPHRDDIEWRRTKIQRNVRALHHEREIVTKQLQKLARTSVVNHYRTNPRYLPLKRKLTSLTNEIARLNVEFRQIKTY